MAETEYGKYIFREPHAKWTSLEPRPERPAEASISKLEPGEFNQL